MIQASELILNADGSIYHLNAKPGEVAPRIITVGDPERVDLFKTHFDTIHHEIHNREFKILTATYKGEQISVISTGIGTDNIDIALNEIDALFNIDFKKREVKADITRLDFVRLGTSGAIRETIPIDSFIVSSYAVGFDGLLHFYDSYAAREIELEKLVNSYCKPLSSYAIGASSELSTHFASIGTAGITLTAPGFYGPQSRKLRLDYNLDLAHQIRDLSFKDLHITNLEMETAGIFGLSALLGHRAISLNAILANRISGEFSSHPQKSIHDLIDRTLELMKSL